MKKRGLSPVIATVLLIVIVVAIALIIFLWFRGVVQEEGTKFGKNVKLVCGDVDFVASYSLGNLQIVNNGNVPLYGMRMKLSQAGSHETIDVPGWPSVGLMSGVSYSKDVSGVVGEAKEITLIPVLLGSTSDGEKTFVCDEQYGYKISTQ